MSMEFKLNSMGGGDSRPLFRDGMVELPNSLDTHCGTKGSGGDEIYEELEKEQEMDSASMTTDHLA